MSVKEMIEGMKELSVTEIEELQNALEQEHLIRLSKEAAKRWAGKTFDLYSRPFALEPEHPSDKRVLFMDLRTNLPLPEQPTAEGLEELRP